MVHLPTNKFYNPNSKGNNIINLIDEYQMEVIKMKKHFNNNNFRGVIDIYEEMLRTKPELKIDSSMIAYSYNMINKPLLAEIFIEGVSELINNSVNTVNDLIFLVNAETKLTLKKIREANNIAHSYNKFHNSHEGVEALFISAQGYLKSKEMMQALHVYFDIIRLGNEFVTKKHLFRAFTKIAEIMMQDDTSDDAELATYYLRQGFQYFDKIEIDSPIVEEAFNFYKGIRVKYHSPQFENFLFHFDSKNYNILRLKFGSIYPVDELDIKVEDSKVESADFIKYLKELAANSENEMKEILSSLKVPILNEEPSFAYVYV